MNVVRVIVGFVLAAAAASILGAISHTQMVIADLERSGAAVPPDLRLAMTANDLLGLSTQYAAVIAIALAIGFAVAAVLKRILKPLALIAYPLAGAAAVVTALILMSLAFDGITPIAGARSAVGLALQSAAGAVGGLVFAVVGARPAR